MTLVEIYTPSGSLTEEKKGELINERRDPDEEALIRYMQGDVDGAISLWQENSGGKKARERFVLASSVRKYMKISENESRDGRLDPSIEALTKALTFHGRIAEGKNGPTGKKSPLLSPTH
jgi:hypothetical protein